MVAPDYLPPVVPARSAKLNDDEIVVGVQVLDKARAYVLNAIKADREVIHDEIGGHKISVEHSLTKDGIYLSVHWNDDYAEQLFEVTTWYAWKKRHPNSDVFLGHDEAVPNRIDESNPEMTESDDQVMPT